jgi:hypothetical protein
MKAMLHNMKTNGFLVVDTGDRIDATYEAYAVTTNNQTQGPIARSVFLIKRADPKDGYADDLVHFGQKVIIQTNPYIFPKTVRPPFKIE